MSSLVTPALALLVALLIDSLWRGAPSRWHPVAGMARYLGWIGGLIAPREARPSPDWRSFSSGAMAWYGGAMLLVIGVLLLQRAVNHLPPEGAGVLLGVLLAPLLSWRRQREEIAAVELALGQSLDAGRRQLGRLVMRPVMQLDAAQVREGALAVLAGQFLTGVVAPVFWFLVAGLPGAALYRFAQQADSIWGHRGFRAGINWEWTGKWAARADDVLAWLPARLAALVIGLAAGGLALGPMRAGARRTASPNTGWPVAALALALGVRVRLAGATINETGDAPTAGAVPQALAITGRALVVLALWVLLVGLVLAWSRGFA